MRIRQTTISAAIVAGLAGLLLTIAEAQYYPQQQPVAQRTTAQLNREELARLQSGNGYSPHYWAPGSPGWGPRRRGGDGVILPARRFHSFGHSAWQALSSALPR